MLGTLSTECHQDTMTVEEVVVVAVAAELSYIIRLLGVREDADIEQVLNGGSGKGKGRTVNRRMFRIQLRRNSCCYGINNYG